MAQVRRKACKNRDFFAPQESVGRCDDLLTTTVDNLRLEGLYPATERGTALALLAKAVLRALDAPHLDE